jgi:hypothetical protein
MERQCPPRIAVECFFKRVSIEFVVEIEQMLFTIPSSVVQEYQEIVLMYEVCVN